MPVIAHASCCSFPPPHRYCTRDEKNGIPAGRVAPTRSIPKTNPSPLFLHFPYTSPLSSWKRSFSQLHVPLHFPSFLNSNTQLLQFCPQARATDFASSPVQNQTTKFVPHRAQRVNRPPLNDRRPIFFVWLEMSWTPGGGGRNPTGNFASRAPAPPVRRPS